MNTNYCKVDLVTNTNGELLNIIDRIKNNFSISQISKIRTVDWSGNENIDVDFRCSVFFSAQKSKKQIYEIMNKIKANPITFLK